MKQYTYHAGHLETLSPLKVGDVVMPGAKIGRIGNTGASDGAHLHHTVIEGWIKKIIRLSQLGYELKYAHTPNIKQLNYFMDHGLFKFPLEITTHFYEPQYELDYKIHHPAYDTLPADGYDTSKHFDFYWNRTKTGIVLFNDFDSGYGNTILIGFES